MKYVGGYSVYATQDKGNRDNIMHDAMQILNKNKWVADMSTAILVSDCLSTISLSRIDCSGMTEPNQDLRNISIMRIIIRGQGNYLMIY